LFRYVTYRTLKAIPTLLALAVITFFMMRLAPGGPFDKERKVTAEVAANLARAREALALLGLHAPFIQFTYGLTSPIARERLGLKGRIAARIWANLPPASVWRYERRRERRAGAR